MCLIYKQCFWRVAALKRRRQGTDTVWIGLSRTVTEPYLERTAVQVRIITGYSALQMKLPTDFCKNVFGFVWPISAGSLPKLPLFQTSSSPPFFTTF